jgi:hypothetical protein
MPILLAAIQTQIKDITIAYKAADMPTTLKPYKALDKATQYQKYLELRAANVGKQPWSTISMLPITS